MKHFAAAILLSGLFGACAASTQVPVKADRDQRIQVSGVWEGAFEGIEGQKGRITFTLEPGRHTAEGAVRLFDKETGKHRVLKIERVQVQDGTFVGTMAPYKSPDCNCLVKTEFRGLVQGDVIDGTFTATREGETEQNGNWSLYRDER